MTTLLPTPIIAVVGSRQSGKTTTAEALVRELTKRDYRVAAVKHIHEPNFTIDARGKDTWRFAQAGAHTIVGVAMDELATIKKTDTTNITKDEITQTCEDHTDIIITEGFRELIARDPTVPKIVTAKDREEINEANQFFTPIIAFTGPIPKPETTALHAPYVDVKNQPQRLAEIVEKRIAPIVQKRRESNETINININGKNLPLNPYVQTVTRNVLFAIISTLKGATIKGNENILIKINTVDEE